MAPRVAPDRETGLLLETHPGAGWSPALVETVRELGVEIRSIPREASFGRIHGIRWDRERRVWVGMADPDWEGTALGVRRPGG